MSPPMVTSMTSWSSLPRGQVWTLISTALLFSAQVFPDWAREAAEALTLEIGGGLQLQQKAPCALLVISWHLRLT